MNEKTVGYYVHTISGKSTYLGSARVTGFSDAEVLEGLDDFAYEGVNLVSKNSDGFITDLIRLDKVEKIEFEYFENDTRVA